MEFKKYQHLERFGTTEVEGIELGTCYVFPKIDGTNASVWMKDGEVMAGSRKRQLSVDSDNAGFYAWVLNNENIKSYLIANPAHRLFGEWLVPHSLKTYKEEAWRQFYVFDVVVDIPEQPSGEKFKYLTYGEYKPLLEQHGVEYIPPICIIENGDRDKFFNQLEKNNYLIKDGSGKGEGVVVKNYSFKNKYGRTTWAKIVTSEFKIKHSKTMGAPVMRGKANIEQNIVEKYVTPAFVEKEFAKIENESGWSSKFIPRLLNTVFYCLVVEESWNFVKDNKNPVIDFRRLNQFVTLKVKDIKPELF